MGLALAGQPKKVYDIRYPLPPACRGRRALRGCAALFWPLRAGRIISAPTNGELRSTASPWGLAAFGGPCSFATPYRRATTWGRPYGNRVRFCSDVVAMPGQWGKALPKNSSPIVGEEFSFYSAEII